MKKFSLKPLSLAEIKPYWILAKAIHWLAFAYSAFILVYLLLRFLFWDKFWPVAFVGSFVPLIFLPIFLLPILAFFVIKKRWFQIITSMACLWLLGWLHLNYWTPEASQIAASPLSLKIFSLNCSWHKTQSAELVELIRQQNPDVIFLQEVVPQHSEQAFVELKDSYPYQFGKASASILSKYPLRPSEYLHLAGHKEVQQRAIVEANGQEIAIYNIQVTSPWIRPQQILPFFSIPSYEFSDRSAEIKDLVERLQQEPLPFILAGDFNLTEQSQDYKSLTTVLQDAFHIAGYGFGFTWPHGWELRLILKRTNWKFNYPIFRIDYIWYSQHWGAKSAKILPTTGSDHLPVAAELVWRGGS